MCLTIPMQITAMTEFSAHCAAKGVERDVSLFMLQDGEVAVGDFVKVHLGYAIEKVTLQEAIATWELYDQVLGTMDIPLIASNS